MKVIQQKTAGNVGEMSLPVTVIISKLPVHNLTEVASMLQYTRKYGRSG
jgi:hypothetical protein